MSETKKIDKTLIKEAANSYEDIKKYAAEAAIKKLDDIIQESLVKIQHDTESGETTIEQDDKVIEISPEGEVEVETSSEHESENEEGSEEDNEPIQITEEEMENQAPQQEQPQADPQQGTEEMPEVTPDTEEMPDTIEGKLDYLINKVNQLSAGETAETEEPVEIVDQPEESPDGAPEQGAAPAPAPAAPVEQQPLQEDEFELDEIELPEISEVSFEESDDEVYDIEEPVEDEIFEIEGMQDEIHSADDNIHSTLGNSPRLPREEKDEIFEIEDEDQIDEMLGVSNAVNRSSLGNTPRYGRPGELNENKKAQYESKIDELKKENASLKKNLNESKETIGEFQNSFKGLKKQFHEMTTFNSKLVYMVKLFANGGFSTSDKDKISEEFEMVKTADEAQKLYSKILKENNLTSAQKPVINKIKSTASKAAASSETLFESKEMKRNRELAGIIKPEEII